LKRLGKIIPACLFEGVRLNLISILKAGGVEFTEAVAIVGRSATKVAAVG
jgi:hypothetical protein